MYTWEEIQAQQGQISMRSHGEDVYESINETRKEQANQSRWFWELLQNAKDAIDKGDHVSISLRLTKDTLEFAHNGKTFQLEEILKLIVQGSTKKEKEGMAGRFGTGFITTYLLSLHVTIYGFLDDGTNFNFVLDREAESIEEFIKKQQTSTRNFFDSFQKNTQISDEYRTKFSYSLSSESYQFALKTLEAVYRILPYVLVFNEDVKKIRLDIDGRTIEYIKKDLNKDDLNGSTRIDTITSSNEGETTNIYILRHSSNDWQIATKVLIENGVNEIVSPEPDVPDLFLFFPLLGTETLGLPVVINSQKFDVKKDRSGIFLGSKEDESNNNNKAIVHEAISSIKDLMTWSLDNKLEGQVNLLKFSLHSKSLWLDDMWLQALKLTMIKEFEALKCIEPNLTNTDRISLKESCIPEADDAKRRSDLWELLEKFNQNTIPKAATIEKWNELAKNYIAIEGIQVGGKDYVYTIENLCQNIDRLKDVTEFPLPVKDFGIDNFLNQLYRYLDDKEKVFCHKYRIVLNQGGGLVKVDSRLRRDHIKDEEVKDIFEDLAEPIRSVLVKNELIDFPGTVCPEIGIQEAVNKITGLLIAKKEAEYSNLKFLKGNARFLKWLIDVNDLERVSSFQIITAGLNRTGGHLYFKYALSTFQSKRQRVLAPKERWKGRFPIYSELIRDKDCMHSIYNSILNDENFEYLRKNHFVYLSPLITLAEKPTKQTLESLLKKPEAISKLYNEKDEPLLTSITYTDFAFFTTSDENVLANNETSKSSLRILNFVVKEAIEKDSEFNGVYTLDVAGESIEFKKSLWVNRLKSTLWVNTKNLLKDSTSKDYLSERPSSYNLAVLVKEQKELIPFLKTEKALKFLSLLDVSVADLIRNTLESEGEKIEWENTFTSLIVSGIQPGLAALMLKDPKLQEQYSRLRQIQSTIKRNQNIGRALEDCFKEILSLPEFSHKGITIERKPWGSDFIISGEVSDSSDLVNDNGEQEIFKVGSWYIELKATGRPYAAMTRLQVQKAVENKGNYALVVLPLSNFEINIENVRDKVLFISDIGTKLESKHNAIIEVDGKRKNLLYEDEGVEINLVADELRYHIKSSLWQNGLSLIEFIKSVFKFHP